LIQEGARLITSADDIIAGLGPIDPRADHMLLEPDWFPGDAFDDEPTADERARLLEALSVTPTSIDALIAATGLSVSAIQTLLLELDLAGRLEWSSGQLVALRE
jgi:DNA processing protein